MSAADITHTCEFSVPPDHPALAGHFPGRPIVPGVVLLDRVLAEADRWLGRALAVRTLPQAKFNAALLPGELAQLDLTLAGATLRFSIRRAATLIAQGSFGVAEPGA